MITNNNTYVAVREDGDLTKMTESKFTKSVKEAHGQNAEITKANEAVPAGGELKPLVAVPEAVHQQTFAKHIAETVADMDALCPNEKVRLTYFNRGYSLAEETFISDQITDDKFAPVEGVFDLTTHLQTVPERKTKKAMSPEDAVGLLRALPKDELQKILAEFMGALTT